MEAEQIFEKCATKHLPQFNAKFFKSGNPKLYKAIIEAINEAKKTT
jgi:hypothetical protein